MERWRLEVYQGFIELNPSITGGDELGSRSLSGIYRTEPQLEVAQVFISRKSIRDLSN